LRILQTELLDACISTNATVGFKTPLDPCRCARTEVPVSEKATLIASICEINPSASTEWLSRFPDSDLRDYLDHLMISMEPAARARWVRRNDCAPLFTREAA
jgi:hypothetical protein